MDNRMVFMLERSPLTPNEVYQMARDTSNVTKEDVQSYIDCMNAKIEKEAFLFGYDGIGAVNEIEFRIDKPVTNGFLEQVAGYYDRAGWKVSYSSRGVYAGKRVNWVLRRKETFWGIIKELFT